LTASNPSAIPIIGTRNDRNDTKDGNGPDPRENRLSSRKRSCPTTLCMVRAAFKRLAAAERTMMISSVVILALPIISWNSLKNTT
jgi:hypothetical protein